MISGYRRFDSNGNDITPMCIEADGIICERATEIDKLIVENEALKEELQCLKVESEKDYNDMRKFQGKYIQADQELQRYKPAGASRLICTGCMNPISNCTCAGGFPKPVSEMMEGKS